MSTRLRKKAMVAVIFLGTISALKKGTVAKMIPILMKMKTSEMKLDQVMFNSSFI
jgi:hypothetical protein